jgi:hypothetical protein
LPRNLKELNSNLPAPNYEDPNKRRIQSAIVPRSTVNAENGNSKVSNLPDPKNIGPDDGYVGKSRNFSPREKPAHPKDETPPAQDSPYQYKRDSLNRSNNLRSSEIEKGSPEAKLRSQAKNQNLIDQEIQKELIQRQKD